MQVLITKPLIPWLSNAVNTWNSSRLVGTVVLLAHLNLPSPQFQFPVTDGTKDHMCTGRKQAHLSLQSSGGQVLISEVLAELSASWRLQGQSGSLPLNFWSCPHPLAGGPFLCLQIQLHGIFMTFFQLPLPHSPLSCCPASLLFGTSR